jgi:type IV secretory pathway TrbD component
MTDYIAGYQAPIYRAIWARILTAGVPHHWCMVWGLLGLFFGFTGWMRLGLWGLGLAGSVWLLGQMTMQWLTRWDVSWDNVLLAQLTRKYKKFYEAG